MNIVFAGTPDFAAIALNALIHSSHSIVGVYCQPDKKNGRGLKLNFCAVKKMALENHLPVFQPPHFKIPENIQILKNLNADILIVAAYGLLLPRAVLEAFPLGAINIHASLLPRWRGAAPIARAIEAGDTQTGISIMQMDEGLDTGDILMQEKCPILETENAGDVHHKLAYLGADCLLKTLDLLKNQTIHRLKQNHDFSTYAHKIFKHEAQINWNESAQIILRKIRAFNPAPGAFTFLNQAPFKIIRAQKLENLEKTQPLPPFQAGAFFVFNKKKVAVWCGQNELILLEEVQKSGGKKMPAFPCFQNEKTGLFTMNL